METDKKHEEIFQLHGQIRAAMLEADPDELKVLQTDSAKYETELRSAAEKWNSAKMREQSLKARLDDQEASFAQEELAEIIRENRFLGGGVRERAVVPRSEERVTTGSKRWTKIHKALDVCLAKRNS